MYDELSLIDRDLLTCLGEKFLIRKRIIEMNYYAKYLPMYVCTI